MSKSVLGIDLAPNHTGFCFIPSDWDGSFYTLRTVFVGFDSDDEKKKMTPMEQVYRMSRIANTLASLVSRYKPDVIAMEGYAISIKSSSAHMLPEFGGALRLKIFEEFNVVIDTVTATAARRAVVGKIRRKRKADKIMGIKLINLKKRLMGYFERRGFLFNKEDEADAFVIGMFKYMKVNSVKCHLDPITEDEQIEYRS
jgi:Holliday junction resolvasome RuvABC endonuclease subunit